MLPFIQRKVEIHFVLSLFVLIQENKLTPVNQYLDDYMVKQ